MAPVKSWFSPRWARHAKKAGVRHFRCASGAVFTEIVPDVNAKILQDVIKGKISLESAVMTDGWRGYDGLADVGYDKHPRIKKS